MLMPNKGSKLVDAGVVIPNLTGPYLGTAPDIGAHEVGLGTAWYGPRFWDGKAKLVYGLPKGWRRLPQDSAGDATERVRLASEDAAIRTILRVEPLEDEARWERVHELVRADDGALTPPLTFQDGLIIRLYTDRLVVARVESDGVLHVESQGSADVMQNNRRTLLQFARSFVR
jgi:hypothetical protein